MVQRSHRRRSHFARYGDTVWSRHSFQEPLEDFELVDAAQIAKKRRGWYASNHHMICSVMLILCRGRTCNTPRQVGGFWLGWHRGRSAVSAGYLYFDTPDEARTTVIASVEPDK